MIALGSVDDIENEIEEIKSTIDSLQAVPQPANPEDKDSPVKALARKQTNPEKQKKPTALSQVMDGEFKNLRKEMEEKFGALDAKIKSGPAGYNPSAFDKFLQKKENDELFQEINHSKRIQDAKVAKPSKGSKKGSKMNLMEKAEVKGYLLHNDMIVYQLYSRYQEIVTELDLYKDKVMENMKFGKKTTQILVDGVKKRKRSNSIQFSVFKLKDEVLGKARMDFLKSPTPDNDLKKWNTNLDGRLEKLERYCNQSVPQKFNETMRNRGVMVQEMRIMESTINNLKHEINDLKNNTSKKEHDKTLFRGSTLEGEMLNPNLKQSIEERFKNVKKNFDREIDQYASDIKSFENKLAQIEQTISNKVDKSVIDNLEANFNNIVKQYIGSNSIASLMKELTDDILTIKDRIEYNFEKYDNRMEDFDKRITRYDEEYQRFLDEAEEIEKYKNKNKVLEIKIDKLFKLLKRHAFGGEKMDEDDLDEDLSIDLDEDGKEEEVTSKRRKSKLDLASKKQIDAIHAMYIKIETEVDDLKEKMKEKDYAAQMVEKSAMEIAQGKKPDNITLKGARERDIHRILNVEFMGMKQLIGKHQISLNRFEKNLRELQEFRNQNAYGKFDQEQRKMAEELTKLINEANETHATNISKLKGSIHSKPDNERLEGIQRDINEKVMELLIHKIDKDEHKRLQMRMSKKLNHLEKEVEGMHTRNNQDDEYKSPFLVTNNKCFSCNRVKEDSPEKMAKTSNELGGKNKFLFKELYKKGPKMGASFSRILGQLNKPETVSSMTRRKDAGNQIMESTPRKKDEKPRTVNPELSKRRFESQKIMTPKVDVNSRSGGGNRFFKKSSAPEIPTFSGKKNLSSRKDRTSVVIHKRNKTERHEGGNFKQNPKFMDNKLKSGSSSRRDLKMYKHNL